MAGIKPDLAGGSEKSMNGRYISSTSILSVTPLCLPSYEAHFKEVKRTINGNQNGLFLA